MGSSGGGGGGYSSMMALMNQGSPMPGLPIAGAGTNIDPYEYGKFQNFLPEPKAEGPNDMATGLRPDMFTYRSPSGKVDPSQGEQIQGLRDELAKLTAAQALQAQQPAQAQWGDWGGSYTPMPGYPWGQNGPSVSS